METVCTLMMAIQVENTRNTRNGTKREGEEGKKSRVKRIIEGMHIKSRNW